MERRRHLRLPSRSPLARYDLQGLVFVIVRRKVSVAPPLVRMVAESAAMPTTSPDPPPTPGEHVAAIWELCIEAGGESHG